MLPNGWEKHPVGKICKSIVPGRNKPKKFDGEIPWVTTPDISGRYIPSSKQKNYISHAAAKDCGAKIVPRGAVVIAAVGELGLTALASEDLILNQQLHAFVCPDNINNEYLAYSLSSQKPYMDTVASKTTIPYMNKSNCESIPVLLPPLPEQRKIAIILSTWDKAIATTEKLIESSKQQKKALMQQLLTGKKRLVNPETGVPFSGDWDEVKLRDLGKCITGLTYSPGDVVDNGLLVLRSSNIQDSKITFLDKVFVSKVVKENTMTQVGDILICIRNGSRNLIGKSAYITDRAVGLTHGAFMTSFRGKYAEYVFQLFQTDQYYRQVYQNLGATINSINTSNLHRFKFLIPDNESEIFKIASVLTAADKEIEILKIKLSHLQKEKKALMQQLLTGKRRVKVEEELEVAN